jgi:hypothetical protein
MGSAADALLVERLQSAVPSDYRWGQVNTGIVLDVLTKRLLTHLIIASPRSGFSLLQTGQRDGRPWLWNVMTGACSQAKNTPPALLLPTMR